MSEDLDKILENALKAQKELSKLGAQTVAKYSLHLDKVDPNIKHKFEESTRNIEAKQKELDEQLENIENLKHKL
jgi:phage-related protein